MISAVAVFSLGDDRRGAGDPCEIEVGVVMRRLVCLLIPCLLAAACSAGLAVVPDSATPPPASTTPVSTIALPTETPFIMPTLPPAQPPACEGAPPTRLILNARGRVLPDDPRPVNLRSDPGTDSRTVASIPILDTFYVLEGPVCEGEYAWFKIQYRNREGWIAEGDLTSYYVEPYLAE
jgi:hypothetical protein